MSTRTTVKSMVTADDATTLGEGRFTALVSVFGVRDSQGDVIMPGAYTKSIAKFENGGDPVPVLYAHNWSDPNANIGKVTAMRQTTKGLVIDGQLDLSNPLGEQAFKLLKDRRITQFSVGGEESDLVRTKSADGQAITQVGSFDLWEVSLCLHGSNPETKLYSTKSDDPETPAEEPQGLHETGNGDKPQTEPRKPSEPTEPEPEPQTAPQNTQAPFAYQLSDEQLRTLIQEITKPDPGTAKTSVDDTGGHPATGVTLPEIEAWAANIKTQILTREDHTMSTKQELLDTIGKVTAITTKAVDENRELTADEQEQLLAYKAQATELEAKLAKNDEAMAFATKMQDMGKAMTAPKPAAAPEETKIAAKGIGGAFIASKAYQDFKESGRTDGLLIPKTRVVTKDDPQINTGNGFGIFPQVQPGYIDLRHLPDINFMALITRGTTASPYLKYRQLIGDTNNAKIVPEGQIKPLSEIKTATAEAKEWTVADGVIVTNQELHDDGAMAEVINGVLMEHFQYMLEYYILHGDGKTDGQPFGIFNTTGVQQISFKTDMVTTLRAAKTELIKANTTLQAIVMNPEDKATIDLMTDKNGQYLAGGPFNPNSGSIWNIPVVESQSVPVGKALMGNFRNVKLLNYEPLTIEAFTQHKDLAQYNETYVRAEERDMLFIRDPRQIAVVDLAADASKPTTTPGK